MLHSNQVFYIKGEEVLQKVVLTPPVEANVKAMDKSCIVYIIKGNEEVITSKRVLKVKKNEALFKQCGDYIAKLTASEPNEPIELIAIHLYPEIIREIYEDKLPAFLATKPRNNKNKEIVALKNEALLIKYFEGLEFYFEKEELIDEELIKIKLKELLYVLHKSNESSNIHEVLHNIFLPTPRAKLQEVVRNHLFTDISVQQLAFLCAKSRSSFIREFKRIYKQPPAQYLKNKKLEKAKTLLLESDKNIKEITFAVGFNEASVFSKNFKVKYGTSPANYRMVHLNKELEHLNKL